MLFKWDRQNLGVKRLDLMIGPLTGQNYQKTEANVLVTEEKFLAQNAP